jgi:DNA-directed RNA polymerase subunit L
MRVNSSKGNPLKEMVNATNSAIESVNELKKLFNSKIKIK